VLPNIAARLEALVDEVGGAAGLREVKHLEPCTVAALRETYPERKVEKNRKVPIPSWFPVGNVDVVVYPASTSLPAIAVELKWCHVDKLYEMEKLVLACRTHTDGTVSRDATVGVCFDADRLDLVRVGIEPDPKLMSTAAGRESARTHLNPGSTLRPRATHTLIS
jgi:hypothetical protein